MRLFVRLPRSTATATPCAACRALILSLALLAAGWLGVVSARSTAVAAAGPAETPPATLPNGVAAGDITQESAVLWARSTVTGPLTFTLALSSTGALVAGETVTVTDPLVPVTATLRSLQPHTGYVYTATDSAGAAWAGRFRTPAPYALRTGLRFGVSGDWRGELSPYPAVGNVSARDLDFFVVMGDSVYADYPSPALPLAQARTLDEFRIKHGEAYTTRLGLNSWAAVRGSTALFATIDDHEVTNDFAGGLAEKPFPAPFDQNGAYINETDLFRAGLQAFHDYNPLQPDYYGATGNPVNAHKRKLYRERTFGSDAALFVLDARSFRDKPLAPVSSLQDIARFIADSYTPGRTMLSPEQLADLQAGLLQAQNQGITWKFVLVPEPIQNLSPVQAQDRFEGYAAERTELLKYIQDQRIRNVVFVSADIHGTMVNNLTYQLTASGPQIQTDTFEITTGSVAFAPPFGETLVELAFQLRLLTAQQKATYDALPVAPDPDDIVDDKDDFVKTHLNRILDLFQMDYDHLGLAGSLVNAELLQGDYVAVHTYGWTEFAIDAQSQELTVTTYGILPYSAADLAADPDAVLARTPFVVSQFVVRPVGVQRRHYVPAVLVGADSP